MGESGYAAWQTVKDKLGGIHKKLPENLLNWRKQLQERLPKEEFDKLPPADAIAWDLWLKDFQERIQAVSNRWDALTAAKLVVRW